MTQFTLFFGRLVAQLGTESAAQLVREFAGQTIQFPDTDHYGEPVKRTVTPRLTILFNGIAYDVSHLPGVAVGDVITVTIADLKPIKRDDFGFPIDAPIIGERYKPLTEAEAKALADKLVQESTRQNGKKLLTHVQAAHRLRERLQFPAYLQDALQKFQQETLANHRPDSLAQDCDCLRAAHSPSPEHQANIDDEGGK